MHSNAMQQSPGMLTAPSTAAPSDDVPPAGAQSNGSPQQPVGSPLLLRSSFCEDLASHAEVELRLEQAWFDRVTGGPESRSIWLTAWGILLRRYGCEPTVVIGFRQDETQAALPLQFEVALEALCRLPIEQCEAQLGAAFSQDPETRSPSGTYPVPLTGLAWYVTPRAAAPDSARVVGPPIEIELCADAGPRLRMRWRDTPLSRQLVHGVLVQLTRLVEALSRDREQLAGSIPLLDERERARLTQEFNATDAPYPADALLHSGFEQQARERPGAVALSCSGQQLTYREVNEWSNRLAHCLRERGVRRGMLVGLCLPRGPELVVAVLAIEKAGGAYVPLEPTFPDQRLKFMLEDVGAQLVLTTAELRARLPDGISYIELGQRDAFDAYPSSNLAPVNEPDDLAYIIFTSGSTGTPKGVAIRHRTAVNLIHWVNRRYQVGPSDRLLFVTSICFDLSVYDVFGFLGAGGSLEIAREADLEEPARLAELLRTRGITFWDSAPAALTQLVPFFGAGAKDLRLVFLSGDWIPVTLPAQVRNAFPNAHVVSLGGATEATIWSNYYDIGEVGAAWPSIPYGRPIHNARYYVLDDHLQPVPPGAAGHLYIGGLCVAAGYHNRDELTRERFVADPFDETPGARMYATGDLACHAGNGELEFLGRSDTQVKIRGYRVELGEIESALSQHESVRTAICVVRKDAGGFNTLYAYVVFAAGTSLDVGELRAGLAQRLPDYMVPAHVIAIDEVPITANGKVDYRRLPTAAPADREPHEAPTDELERVICEAFQELLGQPRVGRRSHFFRLGGHSLLAVQLISRIRSRFGVELSAREVFTHATPEELAKQVRERETASVSQGEPLTGPSRDASNEAHLLSSAQERLWFIQQLELENPAYNIAETFELEGPLDAARLERCLQRVVERHSALRTAFHSEGGKPRAQVTSREISLQRTDARGWPEARVEQWLVEQSELSFDLTTGELLRIGLLERERSHVLHLVVHHIAMDGWSLTNLYRELRAAYADESPPALPLQYADFVVWQRRVARSEALIEARRQWVEQLRAIEPLELPLDHPRPPQQSYAGAYVPFTLDKELVERVEALAAQHGATAFMVFFALYQALLARHSGQSTFSVGVPVSTRARAEFEPMVGFLLNTLPLLVEYDSMRPVGACIEQVRERMIQALAWQDVPFEDIVADLNQTRDESRPPVCQAVFAYQAHAPELQHLGEVTAKRVFTRWRPSRFEITLDLQKQQDGSVRGLIEYATALFAPATIERMVGHFKRLLEQAVEEPHAAIGRLDLLTASEQRQILETFNDTRRHYDLNQGVHRVFERRAQEHPDRVAVRCGDDQVTYAELNRRASRVAHELRTRGVEPGNLVGICVDRTVNMVAAVLGVFKTGAAYVPCDPAYPAERIAYMLESAQATLVISQSEHHQLVAGAKAPILELFDLVGEGPVSTESHDDVEALAYTMYTSGSTGKPKGVEVTQRNVVNLLFGARDILGLTSNDRVLALTTLCFDLSVFELFAPLIVGAQVALTKADEHMGGYRLAELLERDQVTIALAGPIAYRNLLSTGWEGDPKLTVICSGEAFAADLEAPLVERSKAVWNAYGPTETTVWSSFERMLADGSAVSIGRPMPNQTMYVLDEQLMPVPFGVRGELYIGGFGVSHGYRGQPDLTDERFIPSPFKDERIYKTGDIARQRPDGRFEVLGRADNQASLYGYRIEAGEVEAALTAIDVIHDAAVMVREDRPNIKELVGYVIADGTPDFDAIRETLNQTLPRYMIPTRFVQLEAFPKTPNGKLDRKALPTPQSAPESKQSVLTPRTPIEETLVETFKEVLGKEHIGIDDNFFDVGGNSLQILQVIDRLHKRGLSVEPAQLFRSPSVRQLASAVGARVASKDEGDGIIVLQEYGHRPPLFLLHSMPGDLLGYGELVSDLGADQPVYGFHGLGEPHGPRELGEMAREYAMKLMRFKPEGVLHLGGWCFGGTVALEMATLLKSWGRQVGLVLLVETYPSLSPLQEKLVALRQVARVLGQGQLKAAQVLQALKIEDPEAMDGQTFALEITEGPFANRRENYAHNRIAADRHRTRWYPGEITLVRATRSSPFKAYDYGWGPLASTVRVCPIDSSHESVIRRPHSQRVAKLIREGLDRAEERLGPSLHQAPPSPCCPPSANGAENTEQAAPTDR